MGYSRKLRTGPHSHWHTRTIQVHAGLRWVPSDDGTTLPYNEKALLINDQCFRVVDPFQIGWKTLMFAFSVVSFSRQAFHILIYSSLYISFVENTASLAWSRFSINLDMLIDVGERLCMYVLTFTGSRYISPTYSAVELNSWA